MRETVPLTVPARNEERALGPCLDALLASCARAEARLPVRVEVLVVLDGCTDGTEAVARARGVRTVASSGGKVEAMRRGVRPGPFQLFCDADVLADADAVWALCEAMQQAPHLAAAFPPKRPLPPRRRTPLAWALHVYNLRRGFSSQRTWFSGQLFALRRWQVPSREEVAARASRLRPSRFYDWEAGLRVDDVFLSRQVLLEGGPGALRETARGSLSFRAPETWRGMYRYYRRMRLELERLDALFPETREAHRRFGRRTPDLLPAAPASERLAWHLFHAALLPCRAAYRLERAYYEAWSAHPLAPWPPIEETKAL
jgi:glycosyltransferase involved in cell wall biosynthesis